MTRKEKNIKQKINLNLDTFVRLCVDDFIAGSCGSRRKRRHEKLQIPQTTKLKMERLFVFSSFDNDSLTGEGGQGLMWARKGGGRCVEEGADELGHTGWGGPPSVGQLIGTGTTHTCLVGLVLQFVCHIFHHFEDPH